MYFWKLKYMFYHYYYSTWVQSVRNIDSIFVVEYLRERSSGLPSSRILPSLEMVFMKCRLSFLNSGTDNDRLRNTYSRSRSGSQSRRSHRKIRLLCNTVCIVYNVPVVVIFSFTLFKTVQAFTFVYFNKSSPVIDYVKNAM
jgi:hypothetical protein